VGEHRQTKKGLIGEPKENSLLDKAVTDLGNSWLCRGRGWTVPFCEEVQKTRAPKSRDAQKKPDHVKKGGSNARKKGSRSSWRVTWGRSRGM